MVNFHYFDAREEPTGELLWSPKPSWQPNRRRIFY